MRIARKLALLALSACALMAFAASAASAVTPEVVSEATGIHCPAITENDAPMTPEVAGGCPIRGLATDFELGGAFGVMVTCDIILEGKVNEAGATIGTWSLNAGTGNCETGSATPCAGAADAHASSSVLNGIGPWSMTANFCAVAFGLTNRCTGVAGSITESGVHTNAIVFNHANKCSNGVNSLQGTITQVVDAAHPKIEIR